MDAVTQFDEFLFKLTIYSGEKEIDANLEINKKLLKAARILERMVNQNTYNDIAHGKVALRMFLISWMI